MKDVFIVNMNNKEVQQKLCTEPKTTIADRTQFAISYEEGSLRQQTFDKLDKPNIKVEPNEINNINTGTKCWGPTKKCFRCEAPFSPRHLKECKAMGITCIKCGKKGHFAKCCQTNGAGIFAKSRKVIKAPPPRIQRIDEWDSSSNSAIENDKIVLTIDGDENGQFSMSGKINGNPFKTMVDSGSPVTIFEIEDIKRIMKRKTLFIRQLPEDEEYVDFNKRKLNLLGYVFCQLEVGDSKLQKARILVAERGAKSLIGRDWLNAFNYKFVSANQNERKRNICKVTSGTTKSNKMDKPNKTSKPENWNNQQNEQTKLKEQYKELFERQGKLNKHKVKLEFKQNAKITQQKGRRVPIQLQEAVHPEIERLLEEGHFEKVNEVTDKQFIQPVVITVKKDQSVKIALDARAMNNEIVKDKYQMPNLEHLVDLVAEQLNNKEQGKAFYTSLDMCHDPLPVVILLAAMEYRDSAEDKGTVNTFKLY